MALLAASCTGSDSDEGLTGTRATVAPTTVVPAAPTTTIAASPRTVVTISPELGPGEARIGGTVTGPEGPVPEATVRVERLVGDDAAAATTVTSGPDGGWAVESVNGGRYRLRAWRAPDMAQIEPVVVFVAIGEFPPVDLAMLRYAGDGNAVAQVTPSPPVVGQPATVVVSVSDGGVDNEGILHAQPRQGVSVTLGVSPNVALAPPPNAVTDLEGNAPFRITCVQPGPIVAMATVDTAPQSLALPACTPA